MLYDLLKIESRASNAENEGGKKSAGGLKGNGRKASPCKKGLMPGETYTLLETDGPGIIRHIWLTFPPALPVLLRTLVIRMYWDGSTEPSVEAPIGDFFGVANAQFKPMTSSLTSFMNARGLNAWFPMPFKKHAKITVENLSHERVPMLFYQVDFTLGDSISEAGYFHAQYRRYTPKIREDYVLLDGAQGRGRFIGCVLGVVRNKNIPGWWGEGEIKMYFDGEKTPTICGTGVEDYFCMAWGVSECCAPDQGCTMADNENGLYSMYRWHNFDPVCFDSSLKITVQQIGFGSQAAIEPILGSDFRRYTPAGDHENDDMCYYDRCDDYSSVAYWYQDRIGRSGSEGINYDALVCGLMLNQSNVTRNDV